ncbi:MAG: lipoprotein-releasing ABC transporter permease subunit [Methylococcaceae bacterium]|nr:lipoprotein-releasing ABC transporter permease subunit [Methylococcaceae bacterium]MDD1607530.1 lipoprotein-releasing ABC transporter permease subunit [Methylococcaceae bacterium]MDD1615508.1 lipoprotein-releasing ABC transporter permease subunit [Methylococcaceae bacterium]OYV20130.1 MAG: lipoprotein-releasing system permease protein [Methylococcaceae bacterium NSP1-2]
MFKPLIFYIGLRYTRAKRRTQFISFVTLASVLGIALSVTALITVLSVMNGFVGKISERMLSMTSHATITGRSGQLENWQALEQQLKNYPHVQGTAPFISGQVMINADRRVNGTMISGILPDVEPNVSEIADKMTSGKLSNLVAGEYGIILGEEQANYLGVMVGDKVTIISPQVNSTPAGVVPRMRRFTVVGTFKVGMYEYDRNMALIHMDDAAKLFRLENSVSAMRIKMDDLLNAPQITAALAKTFIEDYQVSDWTMAHDNFFQAIKMEKKVMSIILLLMVAVSAFNIVSTLIMVVTDKRSDIAILKTQGLTSASVMGIFMVLGTVIGLFGTILGVICGVLLAINAPDLVSSIEALFHVKFLNAQIYYISELPSELMWTDVVATAGMAFLLSILATIYPAWQAAKINPAEVLRYE